MQIIRSLLAPFRNRGIRSFIKNHLERFHEKKLSGTEFILLSNNCWGYQLYNSLGREYNTPLIGLFIHPDCYIKFISRIDFYLESHLEVTNKSKYYEHDTHYPVGKLDSDVEIHFLHYQSPADCISRWRRRKERLKKSLQNKESRVFAKMCDKGCHDWNLKRFHQIKHFSKISFGANDIEEKSHLRLAPKHLLKTKKSFESPDGNTLYSKRYCYFDIVEWVKTGEVKHTPWSYLLGLFA